MTRDYAAAFIAQNGPLMTEAIETVIGKRPESPNPIERPLGVLEAERKRTGGTVAASSTEGGDRAAIAAPPSQPKCRECGSALTYHEAERVRRLPDQTKYHGCCNECVRLIAGLL